MQLNGTTLEPAAAGGAPDTPRAEADCLVLPPRFYGFGRLVGADAGACQ